MPAPLSQNPPTVTVQLTAEEALGLRQLAIKHTTSQAALAQLAIRQLLAQTKAGAAPLIVASTIDRAQDFEAGAITAGFGTYDKDAPHEE